jgi:hypothetical protein
MRSPTESVRLGGPAANLITARTRGPGGFLTIVKYDATYVALAERLEGGLLTADRPLARSVGAHLGIALITE